MIMCRRETGDKTICAGEGEGETTDEPVHLRQRDQLPSRRRLPEACVSTCQLVSRDSSRKHTISLSLPPSLSPPLPPLSLTHSCTHTRERYSRETHEREIVCFCARESA
jgi:hypothetical protein